MNRKKMMIFAGVGLLSIVILALGAFLLMQRFGHRNNSGVGPGMMMRGRSGQVTAPGGLIAVSANGTPVPAPVDGTKLPDNTASQNLENLNVALALSPYPPVGFEQTNFDITLMDEKGQPVTDALITLDLTMPGMWMPPNALDAKHTEQGIYQTPGRFTMRGLWRIEVIVQRDGKKLSAFFDVGL
jgi:hypothetical protein